MEKTSHTKHAVLPRMEGAQQSESQAHGIKPLEYAVCACGQPMRPLHLEVVDPIALVSLAILR